MTAFTSSFCCLATPPDKLVVVRGPLHGSLPPQIEFLLGTCHLKHQGGSLTVLGHSIKIHRHQGRWTLIPHGRNGVLSVVAYIYKMGQMEILLKNPLAMSSRDGRLCQGLPWGWAACWQGTGLHPLKPSCTIKAAITEPSASKGASESLLQMLRPVPGHVAISAVALTAAQNTMPLISQVQCFPEPISDSTRHLSTQVEPRPLSAQEEGEASEG